MHPIDLQTVFTQADKVGRAQAMQREGLQIQQAIQQVEIQQKAEEHVRAVNEAQDTGDGTEKIKDDNKRRQQEGHKGGKDGNSAEEEKEGFVFNAGIIRDPSLGQNVDISG